jgi:hypothetical protein
MFNENPPRHLTPVGMVFMLLALAALFFLGSARAQAPSASEASAFKPDRGFLKDDPFRKTKQVVQLTGVKSEAELAIVRNAINDVVGFVRLFGITGSNLGNAKLANTTPEQLAEIKAARVTWDAFARMSTQQGRQSMPIEPASGHMATAMDAWVVESDSVLSVRTDFRQTMVELKMVKDPAPKVLRLRFVKQEGKWLFDGASPVAP